MKYKIAYKGILCYGYLTIWIFKKPKDLSNLKPTKFRFKIIAKIICYMFNKTNQEFKTFTVVKI